MRDPADTFIDRTIPADNDQRMFLPVGSKRTGMKGSLPRYRKTDRFILDISAFKDLFDLLPDLFAAARTGGLLPFTVVIKESAKQLRRF